MLYSNGEFIYLLRKQRQILSQYAENSFKIVIDSSTRPSPSLVWVETYIKRKEFKEFAPISL